VHDLLAFLAAMLLRSLARSSYRDRSGRTLIVPTPKMTEPEALSSPVLPSFSYYHSLLGNGAFAISSSFGSVGCIGIIALCVGKNRCAGSCFRILSPLAYPEVS